jgi:hypothetical protein
MVELVLILPILVSLFMGVSTAAAFLNDAQLAGQAVKAGARLAAEDGNAGYVSTNSAKGCQLVANGGTGSPNDPCEVDQESIQTVISVVGGLTNFSAISEIDVYEPCAFPGQACTASTEVCTYLNSGLSGAYQAGDPEDVYKLQGGVWTRQGSPGYTLDLRNQMEPNESPVGVRVVYTFQASAPITFFNFQTSQYATACLAPALEGV